MKSSGRKASKRLLVLLTGVCLTANGLCAADTLPSNNPPKPAPPPSSSSAHSASTHTVAKKAGTPTTPSHSTTHRRVTSHSGTTHYAARKTATHTPSASASKTAPNPTTVSASQHKGSSARHGRPRTLNGPQRLARLHLQPERVQEIQQALIREGYLQGNASGQWDARTHDAMLRYQTDHGFAATGLPEAKSLMKLGLGSHPLPSELDHGPVGVTSPGAAPGDPPGTSPSPPVSQITPPS